MKTTIFNNSQKALSFVLAFALVAVSLFTGVNLSTKATTTEKNIIYWNGNKTAPDESNKDTEGNIIISTAEELNYIATTASSGKSYKIADGIDVIILQPEASVDAEILMGLADYNAVKTYLTETIEATPWVNFSSDPPQFNSSFDGNGVEIYGLYGIGSNVGLFPGIDGGTVYTTEGHTGTIFQNFAVKNSYLESSRRLGIIGAYCATGIGTGSVNVKNCEVSNCYIISSTTTASHFAEEGLLVGRTTDKEIVHIENCLVYGNYSYATGLGKSIPLYAGAISSGNSTVENSVVLGTTPYPTNATNSFTHSAVCFENVYTDQDLPAGKDYTVYTDNDIKKIDANSILGVAAKTQMPNLAWDDIWVAVDGKLPALAKFYDGEILGGGDESGDTNDALCTKNIIYWDGTSTAPDETKVDSEGNIIISTAAELNYIATTASSGKSYKIADGIDVMILQPETSVDAEILMGLADYNAVKTYLTETITPTPWLDTARTGDPAKVLSSFDGNGVEIYGLYATNSNSAGLFPGVDCGTTFQNFALRNSYIQSSRRIGVIGAYCAGDTAGTVSVKNCEISNCYMVNDSTDTSHFAEMGVLLGRTTKDYVDVENCLIYGNYNYATGLDKTISLYAGAASGTISTVENSVILGTAPYPTALTANDYTHSVDCFENVYTDQELPTYTTYADTDIKKIDATAILGAGAKDEMPKLDYTSNWFMVDGAYPALRAFHSGFSVADNGDGTHSENCDCGLKGVALAHTYGSDNLCTACGAKNPDAVEQEPINDCAQNIIYWDSTKTDSSLADKGEKGTADDPIIIDSAEELNYLALFTGHSASTEKHYKISDDIDAIILQSEATVTALGGAGKIMNLGSATAVNKYFADMQTAGYTPSNWITTHVGNQFNGSVDGNGVKIYGMYAVATTGTNSAEAAGLFPVIDAGGTVANTEVETDLVGVTYKDIAIRNSYISSTRRMGALIAVSYTTNYGAKVNGTVNIDGIEVSNCYMRSTSTTERENGVLVGTVSTDITNINNCLVYGNDASWNKSGTVTEVNLLGASAKIACDDNTVIECTLKNSVIFGVKPQPQDFESQFNNADNVENVYTDADISALVSKYSYTDSDMKKVANISEIGDALNATGKWLTSTDGVPSLYAFHDGLTLVASDDSTHTHNCSCGVQGVSASHVYDADYKCKVCDYQHVHSMVDAGVESDADCVSGGIMNTKCENCDYTSTREIVSGGHQFSKVIPATDGDCQTEATVAYKTCSSCGLNFAEDADIHSNEPLEHIGTGYTGRHNWVEQEALTSECGGVESIPYFKCSVCDTYLVEGVMTETKPSEIDGHTASGNYYISENTHANICVTCGDTFSEQAHTDADNNSICDICGWPCGEHIFEGASITLTDSIAVNYMIKKSVIDTLGYENLYIEFTFRGKNYTVSEYTENGEYYVFTFDKIAPHRMTDIIYANLHGTKDSENYTSQTSEYSIKRYCYNMLEEHSDDEKLRTLLVDLLNYGAQAQIYTDYNTDNLANADLTDVQKAWGTPGDVATESVQNLKYKVIDNPTVKWKGAGLYLDEGATLRFTIQTDNIANLVVKVTCGTKTFEIPASKFVKRSGTEDMYYVYVRGINVTQMRESVYLTVLNGETEVSNTICYSVESYAHVQKGGSDTALSNLLVAMMKYGDSAKAYHDAQ